MGKDWHSLYRTLARDRSWGNRAVMLMTTIADFAEAVRKRFPPGSTVRATFLPASQDEWMAVEGTVSKHQFPPEHACQGLLVEVPKDVWDLAGYRRYNPAGAFLVAFSFCEIERGMTL